MKIEPLPDNDFWSHFLAHHSEADTQTLRAVPCDIAVRMETVSILHHDIDQNYRPYLHLRGQLVQITPDVGLPFGITELPYHPGSEPVIDAFYEFDPAQLTELVRKGYFGTRFRVPESLVGKVWELPAEADFLVVAPEATDQPPLVFAGVRDQSSAVFTEETSGHTLAPYFPTYPYTEDPVPSVEGEHSVPTHSGAIRDLFAGEELDDVEHFRSMEPARRDAALRRAGQTPEGVFESLLKEVEAQRQAAEGSKRPGVDYDPDAPEGVLRERITPGVEHALPSSPGDAVVDLLADGTDHTRAADSETAFLDLEEDEGTVEAGVAAPVRMRTDRGSAGAHQYEEDDYQPGS
jgi:hypothetical protein